MIRADERRDLAAALNDYRPLDLDMERASARVMKIANDIRSSEKTQSARTSRLTSQPSPALPCAGGDGGRIDSVS